MGEFSEQDLKRPGWKLRHYLLAAGTELNASTLQRLFREAKPGVRILVILDACHSGNMLKLNHKWSPGFITNWDKMDGSETDPLILCISSCAENENSAIDKQMGPPNIFTQFVPTGSPLLEWSSTHNNGILPYHVLKHSKESLSDQFERQANHGILKYNCRSRQTPILTASRQLDITKFSLRSFLDGSFEKSGSTPPVSSVETKMSQVSQKQNDPKKSETVGKIPEKSEASGKSGKNSKTSESASEKPNETSKSKEAWRRKMTIGLLCLLLVILIAGGIAIYCYCASRKSRIHIRYQARDIEMGLPRRLAAHPLTRHRCMSRRYQFR